ncbi:MAG: type II toxin-antitoxin system VapC family toxin [Sphingomonadales bacterium]|nr:type II toxin-antitoxin system VapC family toxin [Sphingomonadales bacterium]
MIVVDASLALKWFLDEALSDEAEAWFVAHGGTIAVPHVFLTEVTGVLVRRANIDKALRRETEDSLARFAALFDEQLIVAKSMDQHQMVQAARLALDLGHPLKDCIYLALAMELGCELATCDARFAEKARASHPEITLLGEL